MTRGPTGCGRSPLSDMPVSMEFNSKASPSQRASLDEARLKARVAKGGLTPAPGAYDPKRLATDSEQLAGTTAFKSKSDRKADSTLREQGDPGSYNPYDNRSMASNASRSFNRSQQTGAGGFGSKVKRAELSTPNEAPGPGTYDAKLPSSPEAKQGSAFASNTKRGAYLGKSQTPGSGEYDPADVTARTPGGDSMFKNKDDRFKKSLELEYAAHVAPGSYSSDGHTIEKKVRQSRGKVSSAFASTSLRGDMFMGHRC